MIEEEYVEPYEEEEEVEEEEFYQEEEFGDSSYDEPKKRKKLNEKQRKILALGIIIIVSFSLGCAVVGFSMLSNENSARNDLKNNEFFLATIISSFDVTTINSTSAEKANYIYIKDSNSSTFENVNGTVNYIDNKETLEYMVISFPPSVTEMTIESITLHINEKSQLNIVIFTDGVEIYNALKIKKDITLNLTTLASEITIYVF